MFSYSAYVKDVGLREGRVEGLVEGQAKVVKRMMRTKSWDAQEAMAELLIPEEEREGVPACLKRMR